jgi:hypothetical protein
MRERIKMAALNRKVTLEDLITKEVRKIREIALGAVLELKLNWEQGEDLVKAINLEYAWWEGKHRRSTFVNLRHAAALALVLAVLITACSSQPKKTCVCGTTISNVNGVVTDPPPCICQPSN